MKIFLSAITKFAQKNACGYRKLLKTHKVDGFDKLQLENKYNYLSYAAWGKRILNMAKGLKEFMKIPDDAYAKGEKIVVFAETQMDWMVR